jgi:hypothetical protein
MLSSSASPRILSTDCKDLLSKLHQVCTSENALAKSNSRATSQHVPPPLETAARANVLRSIDLATCRRAYAAFPLLAEHEISRNLIGALISHALRSYDANSWVTDACVESVGFCLDFYGLVDDNARIGPTQMEIAHVRYLGKTFSQLSHFEDPARAALSSENAPLFVAAYLADKISELSHYNQAQPAEKKVKITTDVLAYLFRPDVWSKRTGGKLEHKVAQSSPCDADAPSSQECWQLETFPCDRHVLKCSNQVHCIRAAMIAIESCY